jgi:hypothetical protein
LCFFVALRDFYDEEVSQSCKFVLIEEPIQSTKGRKIMNRVYRIIGMLMITVAAAFSVYSQEPTKPDSTKPDSTKPQTTDTAVVNKPTTPPAYVFPSERQRFKRYVSNTVGPFRLARTAFSAGLDQWNDSPEEWEQGAKGYGKRFASSLGRNAIQQTVTYGLDHALHLDTGFERSKRKGFFPRFKDALLETVTSRNKSGNRVFSVPRIAGVYTGSVIAAETWYPERYSYKDGLRNGTRTLVTSFGINLVREFVINF